MIVVEPADDETPAEWLLAGYDRAARNPVRIPTCHTRPIFEVVNDHPGAACHIRPGAKSCRWWSGFAIWLHGPTERNVA